MKSIHTIRKVSYDRLWHVCYKTESGRETYDRVTEVEALRIARKLDLQP